MTGQAGRPLKAFSAHPPDVWLGESRLVWSDARKHSYDLDGNLHSTATATGSATLTATNTYDDLNRLKTLINTGTSGNVISSYSYTRNAVGDITQAIEQEPDGTSRTENYAYDVLDRLTDETVTVGGVVTSDTAYVYDLVGNRWSQTDASGTTNFNYNGDDQLFAQSDPSGVATGYSYDFNGSLTQTALHDGPVTASYTYDDRNRLISATLNGTTKTYTYDDDGNRVSSTTASGTTVYEFDEQSPTGYTQVLAEKDEATGNIQAAYAWGMQLIAQARPSSGTSLYLYDGHGSVRALASISGTITDTYTYDAFGNLTASTGSTPNAYLYSGQRFDSVLGEYDLRARDYNPTTGQFTSMDSRVAGPGDLGNSNLYVYTSSDPVNLLDPTGHDDSLPSLLVGTSIVAGLNGILGAALGARNGWRGAVGGLVGGIDSTYISIYGAVYTHYPSLSFAVGAAIGAASELLITYGPEYFVDHGWRAFFTIGSAFAVGGAIGWATEGSSVYIADELGKRVLERAGAQTIIQNAFRETSQISVALIRRMVVYAVTHPDKAIAAFNAAVTASLWEAGWDTFKGFISSGGAEVVTDQLMDYLVEKYEIVARGFENLKKMVESEVP